MKDLDFDELDRAVSSLMADGQKDAAAPPEDPQPTTSTITPPAPTTTTTTVPSRTPRPTTPPALRRGGRFMDVVHPSAVPKKDSTPPVSRQGVTLQPRGEITSLSPQPSQERLSLRPVAPISTPSTPEVTSPTPINDWPDPLEIATTKLDEGESKEEPSSLSEPRPSLPIPTTLTTDEGGKDTVETFTDNSFSQEPEVKSADELPLSSPFLADAKVEKRPLGGAVVSPVAIGSELMVEDEAAQLPALPKDVEPALPEELHGDVVSIEADDSTTNPTKHGDELAVQEKTQKDIYKETPLETLKKPAVTVTEAAVPSGPTSIPQQYREEPNSGDQKSGAIYDTDTYHQPLAHPAKKKSGWMWVVWIVVILLVGAGGGAALYFLGII